ncbi:hypothetical protein NUU61_008776 [Penicillium alfredii]|uniref:Uncharacterized protein n=1 Tax=Penicillium alfredii TaxID=1506179 RepID=A0A9W9JX17_9EURO|nr:uncharacterized protein NUU61_008776 [Penicillium alfredii]KAJ5084197.1 hypothetical protein NUU61_008776 [Penicillium alfredii]
MTKKGVAKKRQSISELKINSEITKVRKAGNRRGAWMMLVSSIAGSAVSLGPAAHSDWPRRVSALLAPWLSPPLDFPSSRVQEA